MTQEIDARGAKSLLFAIIEQAIADLRRFQKRGLIIAGKLAPPSHFKTKYYSRKEALELLYFFKEGGPMDSFVFGLNLELPVQSIREKLSLV